MSPPSVLLVDDDEGTVETRDDRGAFLSTLPAGHRERRLALAVVLVSVVIFLTAAPFARVPLGQVWAFIPMYESALVINDLITAVLLFGQFSFLRSRALCVLASSYLFTASMTVSHALTFPGLFSPTGLLGAGPQSTAWLFMFWHSGFPLLVIAYALLKDEGLETSRPHGRAHVAVLSSVAAVLVVVYGLTLVATTGQDSLPAIMRGNRYTPAMIIVVSSVWVLSLLALVVLWWRRPHTVLDLWLMVVMCAWLFDIALAAVLNAGRFDLGFYAGRLYGLLAASFVLMVLLIENGRLYARLVKAHERERQERQRVQQRTAELMVVNKELEKAQEELVRKERLAIVGQLAGGVAHELRNPLGVVKNSVYYLKMVLSEEERARKHLQILEREVGTAGRIVTDLLDFARVQPPVRSATDLSGLVGAVLERTPIGDHIDVLTDLAADLPSISVDPEQAGQILANLVLNAAQAMPEGGTLTIETARENGGARVTISDTGVGIPLENLEKIFQPLFTTKAKGIGLGLAVAKSLAEANDGAIRVESAPGRGSRFVVHFARAGEET